MLARLKNNTGIDTQNYCWWGESWGPQHFGDEQTNGGLGGGASMIIYTGGGGAWEGYRRDAAGDRYQHPVSGAMPQFYHDNSVRSTQVWVHEFGHCLGYGHSGLVTQHRGRFRDAAVAGFVANRTAAAGADFPAADFRAQLEQGQFRARDANKGLLAESHADEYGSPYSWMGRR